MPMSPPCSRTAAIVSVADSRGGIARSMNAAIRSPSAVRISSPTMTVRSSPSEAAAARPESAPSIRSWSVIARWVRPR
jgi:hypothetical protein